MEIIPIAFDSMGVRSMCTQVITKDASILIDPSVSLAPLRFGLEPHPIEWQRMNENWDKILELSKEVDIIILTHFHFDHFSWNEPNQFKDKILLIKHPTENINFSQKSRARYFLEQIKKLPKKLEYCDGKKFEFGETKIEFSKPVFHGTNQKLGWVIEVLIKEENEKFIFTSDVEGPSIKNQVEFIIENKPNFLIIDGPMTYMLGYKYGYENFQASIQNLIKILKEVSPKTLILDHHLLRDLKYVEKIAPVFKASEETRTKILTAAEFLGKPVEMLEARRKELYQKYPEIKQKKKKVILGE